MMQIHLEQHLEKYIENTPVILNEQTPFQLTLWYQILHDPVYWGKKYAQYYSLPVMTS